MHDDSLRPVDRGQTGDAETDSPAAAAVTIAVPHILGERRTGQLRHQDRDGDAAGRGWGSTPRRAANGLQTCTDAQFGKGDENPIGCPPQSKIGTVTIKSPPLPEGNLEGNVYVGQQLSRDPTSGQEYRIFVDAESARYGIDVRLVGNVSADPITGQLTTTFAETPQVPFTSFELDFDGGASAVLSSPPTCGPNTSDAQMTPWSGNAAAGHSDPKGFTLTTPPGRRHLRENDGRTSLRAELRGGAEEATGRRLQPALDRDRPRPTASRS